MLPKDTLAFFQVDIDYLHPLFSGVFEKATEQGMVGSGTPLYDFFGEFEPIIKLRNGDPFLIRSNDGQVYFFNTILKSEFSNFASNAIFLPLMYQIAFSSLDYDSKSYYYPGDLVLVDVKNGEIPPVIVSDDFEVIPEFNPVGSQISFSIPTDLVPSSYYVLHDGDTLMQLAVNPPKSESIMQGLTLEDLEKNFGSMEHVSFQSIDGDIQQILATEKSGFWKYALILVVLLLITETMLHRYLR